MFLPREGVGRIRIYSFLEKQMLTHHDHSERVAMRVSREHRKNTHGVSNGGRAN
jgi:hypothetical protein